MVLPSVANTRLFRLLMNMYPMFFGTGGKILYISKDWKEVKLRLGRNIWTYNFVGTTFGGSMFAAADPFYMLMLFHILGKKEYVVWDKSASIKFIAPGKTKLYADLALTDAEISQIKEVVKNNGFTLFDKTIEWKDRDDKIYAAISRTVYIASKEYYANRKK